MRHNANTLSTSTLNTNLNELAHNFVRELAMAAKKVSIYGSNHQVAQRALEKPFLICRRIHDFKKYVNFNLQKGDLCLLNILLKESIFTADIVRYMQILDISAILLDDRITQSEFSKFVDRLVKRVSTADHSNLMDAWLKNHGVDTVEVDTEVALEMFEQNRIYRGEVSGDFSVRGMALQQLGNDLRRIIAVSRDGESALEAHRIDFHLDIVNYVLPEKIASFSSQEMIDLLRDLSVDENKEDYRTACKLLEYHPERDAIVGELETSLGSSAQDSESISELIHPTGKIRIETSRAIDNLTEEIFSLRQVPTPAGEQLDRFNDSFSRLLKTGQQEKAVHKLSQLMDLMTAPETGYRQKALSLLISALGEIRGELEKGLLSKIGAEVVTRLEKGQETFEYSEFIWRLLEQMMIQRRFDLMENITEVLSRRRSMEDGVIIYDSMVIKQVFFQLNRREVLATLLDELVGADFETALKIRSLLVNIGSEEVALALTDIISHPERMVRQHALKTLAEMGKPAVKVCSQILSDDRMFERGNDRLEISDARWYVIRNAIFVLGLLEDADGINALRLRFNDTDIRVRREVIAALEKIGGEDACDILVLMGSDPVKEIRDKAVITVGLIGTQESVPLLVDLARKQPAVAIHAITAMGKLAGPEALLFLFELLDNAETLSEVAAGVISKDDLRLAVVKALATIGDETSIARLKAFQEAIPTAQKLFFKNSAINKAISEAISRR